MLFQPSNHLLVNKMDSKLLLLMVASISLAHCHSGPLTHKETWNRRTPTKDRPVSSGIPQWVTAWAFVALFFGLVSVFFKCGKEDFNLTLVDLVGYLTAFCSGLLCAFPCLWLPIVCCTSEMVQQQLFQTRRSAVQQPEPAENNSGAGVHERDPEALPDYPDNLQTTPPDHPDQTTLPDHPDQTNLPNHPDQTNLPDYSDQPSPSAPPSELRTVLPSATDVATLAVPARSIEDVLETPPSYEAVMRGEF